MEVSNLGYVVSAIMIASSGAVVLTVWMIRSGDKRIKNFQTLIGGTTAILAAILIAASAIIPRVIDDDRFREEQRLKRGVGANVLLYKLRIYKSIYLSIDAEKNNCGVDGFPSPINPIEMLRDQHPEAVNYYFISVNYVEIFLNSCFRLINFRKNNPKADENDPVHQRLMHRLTKSGNEALAFLESAHTVLIFHSIVFDEENDRITKQARDLLDFFGINTDAYGDVSDSLRMPPSVTRPE